MIITYQGDTYYKFQSGNTTLLVDPTNQRGYKGADAIINTTLPAAAEKGEEATLWVDHQGEFETKGIRIMGWSTNSKTDLEKTIYRVEFDEIIIGFLGTIEREPSEEVKEHLKGCDILCVPTEGKPIMSAEIAARLVRQIEPAMVIVPAGGQIKSFLKEMSAEKTEAEEKLVIKKKDFVEKAMKVVVLKA